MFDLQVHSMTEESQSRTQVRNLEAGTESDYGETAYWLVSSVLLSNHCYKISDHLPIIYTSHSKLGPSPSSSNHENFQQTYLLANTMGQFFN